MTTIAEHHKSSLMILGVAPRLATYIVDQLLKFSSLSSGGLVTSYTDHAGTITNGGVAQPVMPANTSRQGFHISNDSDTAMRVAFGATPASASLGKLLQPGIEWVPPVVPTEAVTVFCVSSSKAYSAGEWS